MMRRPMSLTAQIAQRPQPRSAPSVRTRAQRPRGISTPPRPRADKSGWAARQFARFDADRGARARGARGRGGRRSPPRRRRPPPPRSELLSATQLGALRNVCRARASAAVVAQRADLAAEWTSRAQLSARARGRFASTRDPGSPHAPSSAGMALADPDLRASVRERLCRPLSPESTMAALAVHALPIPDRR